MIRIINPKEDNKVIEAFRPLLPAKTTEYPTNWMMLGAVNEENEALGLLAFAEEADRFRITHLYVEEEVRRQGIADQLVSKLLHFVETTGLYMDIEAEFTSEDPLLCEFFLEQPYFNLFEKGSISVFSAEQVKRAMRKLNLKEHISEKCLPFFEQPVFRQREVLVSLEKQGAFNVNDVAEWNNLCCNELCVCTTDKDGKIDSYVFVEDRADDLLSLSYIGVSNPIKALELLGFIFRKYEELGIEKGLVIEPVSEAGSNLMTKILSDPAKRITTYVASWNYTSPEEFVAGTDEDEEEDDDEFAGKEVVFEFVSEDDMAGCKGCKYSTGNAGFCQKYEQKPDAIILGATCPYCEV